MTTEQAKSASPPAPEQLSTSSAPTPAPVSAPTSVPQFPHFAGAYPTSFHSFFAYPQSQQGEGSPAPLSYPLIYSSPGVVYALPSQPPVATTVAQTASASNGSRSKRQQVKMACTNCANACKRCNEERPCDRCKKYGIADTCVDGQRKERKKGVKRGPYKRKTKSPDEYSLQTPAEEGWPLGSSSAPVSPPQSIIHAPLEGFYPVYLPPGYPVPDSQTSADGATLPAPPAFMPFYIPFPYPPIFLPPSGTHPLPPPAQPATAEAGTVSAVIKNSEEATSTVPQMAGTSVLDTAIEKPPQDVAKANDNITEISGTGVAKDGSTINA